MSAPGNAKAVPAGPRNGSQNQKQLSSNFEDQSYRRIAKHATADLEMLVRHVLEHDGLSAFEMPKRAAAIHEAGHAILFEADGIRVRTVRIKPNHRLGAVYWSGRTSAGEAWRVWPGTPVRVILQRLRFEIAGIVAEMLHAGDEFLSGSSLDEVSRARQLAKMASLSGAGRAEDILVRETVHARDALERHEGELLALADALEAEEWLRGHRLAELLAPMREGVH